MVLIFCLLLIIRPFISPLAYPFADTGISLLFLGLMVLWFIRRRPMTNPALRPLLLPILSFFSLLVISSFFAAHRLKNVAELYRYLTDVLLLVTVVSMKKDEKETVITAIIFSGLLICACAFYQFFYGFRHLADYLAHTGNSNTFAAEYLLTRRVFFPFVTPNLLGGYLAMILPLALYRRGAPRLDSRGPIAFGLAPWGGIPPVPRKRDWLRGHTAWTVFLFAAAILLTRSLGAILGLSAGLLWYMLLRRNNTPKVAWYCMAALVVSAAGIFLLRSHTHFHMRPLFSSGMRITYWQETWRIIRAFPLTGVGIGNFNLIHSRYAHNAYLQLAAGAGIGTLAAFMWLTITALKELLQRDNADLRRRMLIATAAIIFLAQNMVDFSFFLPETATLWWVLIGL